MGVVVMMRFSIMEIKLGWNGFLNMCVRVWLYGMGGWIIYRIIRPVGDLMGLDNGSGVED